MAEITLEFLARQLQRLLSDMQALRGSVDIVRRDVAAMTDDVGIIKGELQGLRADQLNIRREINALRHDMRAGFDALDARLRPLEAEQP